MKKRKSRKPKLVSLKEAVKNLVNLRARVETELARLEQNVSRAQDTFNYSEDVPKAPRAKGVKAKLIAAPLYAGLEDALRYAADQADAIADALEDRAAQAVANRRPARHGGLTEGAKPWMEAEAEFRQVSDDLGDVQMELD
jgi:ElaB/YqjD/DUF883 family membrane-anchored ribosome-binding protein